VTCSYLSPPPHFHTPPPHTHTHTQTRPRRKPRPINLDIFTKALLHRDIDVYEERKRLQQQGSEWQGQAGLAEEERTGGLAAVLY
jgi:hypothetical protein